MYGHSVVRKGMLVHEYVGWWWCINFIYLCIFYCFHLDFRCVTLVRYIYIYIYIYNMDLKKSLIIENLYNSNREV